MLTPIQFIELLTVFIIILYTAIAISYIKLIDTRWGLEYALQCLGYVFVGTLIIAGMLICALTPQ